jgi:hypothetical protein
LKHRQACVCKFDETRGVELFGVLIICWSWRLKPKRCTPKKGEWGQRV